MATDTHNGTREGVGSRWVRSDAARHHGAGGTLGGAGGRRMREPISLEGPAIRSVLNGLEEGVEEFDGALAEFPTEVDAGAASALVSDIIGELLDASIHLATEAGTLIERSEGALGDLSEFDHTTSSALKKSARAIR